MNTEQYLPHISVDCVIFGFEDGMLHVLTIKLKTGDWSLPGGFVRSDEPLEQAAHRVLTQRTGLHDIFLQQFHVFGSPERENDKIFTRLHREKLLTGEWLDFLKKRFISVAFYALVKQQKADISTSRLSTDIQWTPINQLPELMMDHGDMVDKALERLRSDLNHHPVGLSLLPQKFTMRELQQLYEAILGRQLDRRNFSRKILRFGILRKLDERRTGVAHKSPQLYSFDKVSYEKALEEGFAPLW